ncbi:MAG: methionine gamma-lyase family protein [Syntrophomonadaceae bacterium]
MTATELIKRAEKALQERFACFEDIAYQNQVKILEAFQQHRVREAYFSPSSGYGYGDTGRDELEEIYAEIMGAEEALLRSTIVSGTHAISACLQALVSPGQEILSLAGRPYDTLCRVIGTGEPLRGTLTAKGIIYREAPLDRLGKPDPETIRSMIGPDTRLALIQRSRGYMARPSLTVGDIDALIRIVRAANPETIVFVDNCYGEFTALLEPVQVGADIMAGSLIKNPGGGLAPSGGYVTGRRDMVEMVAEQLTAPGLGKALGASLTDKRWFYQGLFLAPHTVLQALKGAALLAHVFSEMGFEALPGWDIDRGDIVQGIRLKSADQVLRFCQTVQASSPVDSDVRLEFARVPGYDEKIIMAAGTFVQGSSMELSCDAPLREPYIAYLQGGLTYEHCRWVVKRLAENMLEA